MWLIISIKILLNVPKAPLEFSKEDIWNLKCCKCFEPYLGDMWLSCLQHSIKLNRGNCNWAEINTNKNGWAKQSFYYKNIF